MKSKISQCLQTGTSQWNGKELVKYAISLENGDAGIYTIGFSPNDVIPAEGIELDYELIDKGYGPEIKANKPASSFSGGGGKKWTPEQVSEQNAVKLTCSALEGGKLELKNYKAFYTDCYNWFLNEAKKDAPAPTPPTIDDISGEGLPF